MAKRANYKDQYKSTGWCKALGRAAGTTSGMASGAATRAASTRAANAEARSVRMDAIIDRYVSAPMVRAR